MKINYKEEITAALLSKLESISRFIVLDLEGPSYAETKFGVEFIDEKGTSRKIKYKLMLEAEPVY